MNIDKFKQSLVHNVYHLSSGRKVALHQHPKHDEVFYCFNGSGFGVLEDREVPLSHGSVFVVPARTMHSLRTDGDLYVTSSLIPLANHGEFDDLDS